MDTGLIFPDRFLWQWSDGLLYVLPIIGFGLRVRGRALGKSGAHYPEHRRNFLLRGERELRARFQENLLRLTIETTVPQTDTGGQLE